MKHNFLINVHCHSSLNILNQYYLILPLRSLSTFWQSSMISKTWIYSHSFLFVFTISNKGIYFIHSFHNSYFISHIFKNRTLYFVAYIGYEIIIFINYSSIPLLFHEYSLLISSLFMPASDCLFRFSIRLNKFD